MPDQTITPVRPKSFGDYWPWVVAGVALIYWLAYKDEQDDEADAADDTEYDDYDDDEE